MTQPIDDAGRIVGKRIEIRRNSNEDHRWGVILAGGDGVRLRSVTRLVSGDDRPKQFSPLLGGKTLLAQTRLRTAGSIHRDQTLFVLTRAHEPFYASELETVPASRMVVQPTNRGTLPAILWSLLRIIRLDHKALVVFLPSDHYYSEEEKFMAAIASAFNLAEVDAESVILLGAMAKRPEIEYGWIEADSTIASPFGERLMRVKRFWEKPSYKIAQGLLEQGCLWNTFVMVGSAHAFVDMIRNVFPALYSAFEPILSTTDPEIEARLMRRVYARIPAADFSKQVLSISTDRLAVASFGDIGWSDLGDPRRLITTLFESGIENPWVASGSCNSCGLALSKS
ncbi:MAG: sugar phosphate nucleotidyltransferase [Acidobacteriota bacterium]|nr:sugar phosphate nucleotidyltransferase [Acidobacteriota bacterium]